MKNTRLILLANPDSIPLDIAQLFASNFEEVIIVQDPAEVNQHICTNGFLTRLLLFNPQSDVTRQFLSLLARMDRDNSH